MTQLSPVRRVSPSLCPSPLHPWWAGCSGLGHRLGQSGPTTDLIVDWIEQRYSQNEAGKQAYCGNRK